MVKLWNSKIGIIWNLVGIVGLLVLVVALLIGLNVLAQETSRTIKEFLGIEAYW